VTTRVSPWAATAAIYAAAMMWIAASSKPSSEIASRNQVRAGLFLEKRGPRNLMSP
jgi:hypothetical protein